MLIKKRRAWELPVSAATPEDIYMKRRQWLKAAGFAGLGLAGHDALSSAAMAAIGGYPFERNPPMFWTAPSQTRMRPRPTPISMNSARPRISGKKPAG